MRIYIPTFRRVGKQKTFSRFTPEQVDRYGVTLVVVEDEADAYGDLPVMVCPYRDIGRTRQWVVEQNEDDVILMMDDDLQFAERRVDDPTLFLAIEGEAMEPMLQELNSVMQEHAHGAISHREGANRVLDQYRDNDRMLRALAFRPQVLIDEGVRFDRLPFMEDFDVNLQLLKLGYPSRMVNDWTQGQDGSQNPGGCSETRTMEAHARAAFELWEYHPDVVRLTQKKTRSAWGGTNDAPVTRTDVVISWKKALSCAAAAAEEPYTKRMRARLR